MEIILLTNNAKPPYNIVYPHTCLILCRTPANYRFVTKFNPKFGKSEEAVKKILRNDYRIMNFFIILRVKIM